MASAIDKTGFGSEFDEFRFCGSHNRNQPQNINITHNNVNVIPGMEAKVTISKESNGYNLNPSVTGIQGIKETDSLDANVTNIEEDFDDGELDYDESEDNIMNDADDSTTRSGRAARPLI